jgi:predicted RNA binding protein YcfA (HicA-like mRNA interferase family)
MKVKDIITLLIQDGWYEVSQKGSHKQYKHKIKKGRVTVSYHGRNIDIPPGTLNSILKQAGLK